MGVGAAYCGVGVKLGDVDPATPPVDSIALRGRDLPVLVPPREGVRPVVVTLLRGIAGVIAICYHPYPSPLTSQDGYMPAPAWTNSPGALRCSCMSIMPCTFS